MSGPNFGQPRPLPADLVTHHRDLLLAHADDPILGACPICTVHRCHTWLYAYEQLTSAGVPLTADPQPVGTQAIAPKQPPEAP